MNSNAIAYLQHYQNLGLTPIPLCTPNPEGGCLQHGTSCTHPGKRPLVRWRNNWNPTPAELERWNSQGCNWGVRCGPELVGLDFDKTEAFYRFLESHPEANSWPRTRTGRGFHLWVRPKKTIRSQSNNGLEVKCGGTYLVAPPSVHPSGATYTFDIAPDGTLPEVDLEETLGLGQVDSYDRAERYESVRQAAPSDFALRYGKSPYPPSLCGKATKILTRSDGKVKHLVSLRCWKWHCPKCAPLLQRYWLRKLLHIPFRFILRLPTMSKPTALLRRIGKPDYAHMIANGISWLFLTGGDADKVWEEAQKAGYDLIAGDISGDPSAEEIIECLEDALCREDEPLNSRRKVTHSRGLLKMASQEDRNDESKQQCDCGGGEDVKASIDNALTWKSEVVMKPVDEVSRELEQQGWRVLWQSEVEAIAIKGRAVKAHDLNIVD